MKHFIFSLLIVVYLFSCNNNNDDDTPIALIGSWGLIEQYADPGDGSGDFVTVNSNKIIDFLNNGTIISNGTLCGMTISSDEATTGTYNPIENTITPDNCNNGGIQINYELVDGVLLLHYPCIEACSQKFIQVDG